MPTLDIWIVGIAPIGIVELAPTLLDLLTWRVVVVGGRVVVVVVAMGTVGVWEAEGVTLTAMMVSPIQVVIANVVLVETGLLLLILLLLLLLAVEAGVGVVIHVVERVVTGELVEVIVV